MRKIGGSELTQACVKMIFEVKKL